MPTKTNTVFYHITSPSSIKWYEVTEQAFFDAKLLTAQKERQYKSCLLFSCINPTKYKRRHYIQFQGRYFTALIPLGMQFINIVEQLETERRF